MKILGESTDIMNKTKISNDTMHGQSLQTNEFDTNESFNIVSKFNKDIGMRHSYNHLNKNQFQKQCLSTMNVNDPLINYKKLKCFDQNRLQALNTTRN